MHKIRSFSLVGVVVTLLAVLCMGVKSTTTYAVPVNAADKASQKAQEKSADRSNLAGWMQADKVYAAENMQPENTASMQICEKRQPNMQSKIAAIVASAVKYETKLNAVYADVVRLREDRKVKSPEIDALVMTASSVKENRVDPVVEKITSYETTNKPTCSAGVENVIATLIQVQSTTDQLRDALAEYRNSIKAVVFAVRDYLPEATR